MVATGTAADRDPVSAIIPYPGGTPTAGGPGPKLGDASYCNGPQLPDSALTAAYEDVHPSAAMHKYTACPTVRRAVTGDCYAANDAKSS